MERMWSPWRSKHIERMAEPSPKATKPGSVFTHMAAQDHDTDNLILWRGPSVFVVMNLYPYNNGHLMIVPYREVAQYEDLTAEEQADMAHTLARCLGWLRQALNPEGFNVGLNLGLAAGAGIPEHLHMHVVPRWRADTNFMPTIAEIKVVPEALEDTFHKLRAVIKAAD